MLQLRPYKAKYFLKKPLTEKRKKENVLGRGNSKYKGPEAQRASYVFGE